MSKILSLNNQQLIGVIVLLYDTAIAITVFANVQTILNYLYGFSICIYLE